MSEQLQGRALDEAVARILGTTDSVDMNPAGVPYMSCFGMESPRYSTDPATLTEMLEWLKSQPDHESTELLHETGEDPPFYAEMWDSYGWSRNVRGATINEALARLVLAVAGRDAK